MSAFYQLARPQSNPSDEIAHLLHHCDHRIAAVRSRSELGHSSRLARVLLQGWICKYRMLANGRRQIVRVHLSGDVCDWQNLFFPEIGFGLHAASDCQVAEIPVNTLKTIVADKPAMGDLFWRRCIAEKAAMAELITSLGSRSGRERVAWFLHDLAERLHQRGDMRGGAFQLKLRQVDLADTLGVSTVHIGRILQSLKSDGLIASWGSTFRVLDLARLQATAVHDASSSLSMFNG